MGGQTNSWSNKYVPLCIGSMFQDNGEDDGHVKETTKRDRFRFSAPCRALYPSDFWLWQPLRFRCPTKVPPVISLTVTACGGRLLLSCVLHNIYIYMLCVRESVKNVRYCVFLGYVENQLIKKKLNVLSSLTVHIFRCCIHPHLVQI